MVVPSHVRRLGCCAEARIVPCAHIVLRPDEANRVGSISKLEVVVHSCTTRYQSSYAHLVGYFVYVASVGTSTVQPMHSISQTDPMSMEVARTGCTRLPSHTIKCCLDREISGGRGRVAGTSKSSPSHVSLEPPAYSTTHTRLVRDARRCPCAGAANSPARQYLGDNDMHHTLLTPWRALVPEANVAHVRLVLRHSLVRFPGFLEVKHMHEYETRSVTHAAGLCIAQHCVPGLCVRTFQQQNTRKQQHLFCAERLSDAEAPENKSSSKA